MTGTLEELEDRVSGLEEKAGAPDSLGPLEVTINEEGVCFPNEGPEGEGAGLRFTYLGNAEGEVRKVPPGCVRDQVIPTERLCLSVTDAAGVPVRAFLEKWGASTTASNRAYILWREPGNAEAFAAMTVFGSAELVKSEGTEFIRLAATFNEAIPAGWPSDGVEVELVWVRTGDQGKEGPEGKQGPEGPPGPNELTESVSSIRWFEGATAREYIRGFLEGTKTHILEIAAQATGEASKLVRVFLESVKEGAASAQRMRVQAAEVARTILDGEGRSDFLQLAATSKRKIAFGRVKLTWAGSTLSGSVNVAHGLGVAPGQVVFSAWQAPEPGKVPIGNITGPPSATEFTCNAETKNAHTGSIELSWIAIA